MASLTKDSFNRSPYWTCCYIAADGRRLKKSTKQTDKDKAMEVCLALQRAEDQVRLGLLTEHRLKTLLSETLERVTGDKLQTHTAAAWLDHWLETKEQVRAGKTLLRYRQVVRDFKNSLGTRTRLPVGYISSKEVFAYRNAILKAGKTARTANLSMKVISAALNAARRQGHIDVNPCEALEGLRVNADVKGVFSAEQVKKLVKAADGDWRPAIMLGFYSGARLGDVVNMTWQAVDLKERVIQFIPSKTKKPIVLPIHADLERELLKKPGVGKAPLFPMLAGRGTGGRTGLSNQFAAIVKRAGIESKRMGGGIREQASLTFHSLRHSFNSVMANAGVSQEVRQKLTGHASAEMNELYTHHELEPLRAAIAVLPSLTRQKAK
jgi:integrase